MLPVSTHKDQGEELCRNHSLGQVTRLPSEPTLTSKDAFASALVPGQTAQGKQRSHMHLPCLLQYVSFFAK